MEDFVQGHRQRVVAAGRAACTYTQPHADADEQRADNGGDQRHLR